VFWRLAGALAILIATRCWRPALMVVPAALAVVAVFAAYGFYWWEAYPVLVERYWAGLASERPISYWWWGNLAALLVSAGPLKTFVLRGPIPPGTTRPVVWAWTISRYTRSISWSRSGLRLICSA
jgi:hypothetical protein